MGLTKCLHSGSDRATMSLESWNSRSNRNVCVDTRQTTRLSTGASVALIWVAGTLASLPDDLWLRASAGRLKSGAVEDIEFTVLRPLETGRSREVFCVPKKCQLSYDCLPASVSAGFRGAWFACRLQNGRVQCRYPTSNWAARANAQESERISHSGQRLLASPPCSRSQVSARPWSSSHVQCGALARSKHIGVQDRGCTGDRCTRGRRRAGAKASRWQQQQQKSETEHKAASWRARVTLWVSALRPRC
jgi:hypothetical protein